MLRGEERAESGRGTRKALIAIAVAASGALVIVGTGLPGFGAPATLHSGLRSFEVTTVAPAAPTTTTTVAPAPTTTTTVPKAAAPPKAAAAPAPAPTPKPAPAPAPAPSTSTHRGILPPNEPPANIPPSPNFLQDCQGTQYDDSTGCVNATLSAIANARAQEGVPAMVLPSNWYQLSVTEQIYVVTNLERIDRGLPALSAMATQLDQAAAQGAQNNTDPSPPSGFPFTQWGSNWAGAVGNPLEAMYYWMYDDGVGSSNIECTQSNQSGCWGHRQNVLMNLSCQMCVMGTGYAPTAWNGDPSLAEILVDSSGQPATDFTWQQEEAYL